VVVAIGAQGRECVASTAYWRTELAERQRAPWSGNKSPTPDEIIAKVGGGAPHAYGADLGNRGISIQHDEACAPPDDVQIPRQVSLQLPDPDRPHVVTFAHHHKRQNAGPGCIQPGPHTSNAA